MLEVRGVSKNFGGVRAVDDMSFTVGSDEIHGLIGPNGAGKTTMINLISGLLSVSRGEIYVDGVPVHTLPAERRARLGVARTFQNLRLFNNLTVAQNIEIAGFHARGDAVSNAVLVRDAIDRFGLREVLAQTPDSLPYGQMRRLEIVRAPALLPKVLMLDEPAAGMNPEETADLMDNLMWLKERHPCAIILIEHDLKFVMSACDRLTVMNMGGCWPPALPMKSPTTKGSRMPISGMPPRAQRECKMIPNKTMRNLLLTTAGALGLMTSALHAEDVIKVGFPVPLTGGFAPYTEVAGARCMAEMINRDGGVDGKKFELLVQDTDSDTQTAISLAEKFLGEGIMAIGTNAFSDTLIPVAQLAAPLGVTVIQAQSTQVEMHTGVVDNFLANVSPDPFTATAAANYALSQGIKNVVIFKTDEGGSWSARTPEWFADVIVANGGTLQDTLNYTGGTTDWSPQIAELKALDPAPDAVYLSWGMPDIGVLIRQMRAAGLDAWVVGSDGFDDPSLDALAADDPTILDKVFFGTLAPALEGSRIDTFEKQCADIGIEVNGLFPSLGADVIKTIAYGVEASGSTDPFKIHDAIVTADSIPVMSVESISYKDTGSYAQRQIPVIGFKDGKRVLLSLDIPTDVPAWP